MWKDEYLKWICGFANASGGKLCLGVDDNGKVIGIGNAEKLSEDLPNKIRDALGIMADVNLLEENGLQYIEIDVPPYSNPINYKGRYFYRSGSTMQELKGAPLNRFLMKKAGLNWDDFVIENVKVEDLSPTALARFRKEAARSGRVDEGVLHDSDENLLKDLRLLNEDGQLNRAAVMLFHPDPERFAFGSYIKIGFFRDDRGNLEFQDEIHGPLMEQVDKAMDLIRSKYLIFRISYDGIHRVEMPQFPVAALRESLMNSVAHKDYASSTPIQISVFPDHITFWNAGQLPEDWTTDKLFESHPSRPFNPLIANAFFRSGDIESWGRGYKRIMDAVSAHRLLPPQITEISVLMITYYSSVRAQLSNEGTDERIISAVEYAVKNGKITNSDLQNILGVSKTTAFRILQQTAEWLVMKGKVGKGTYYMPKWFTNGSQMVQI